MSKTREKMFDIARRTRLGRELVSMYSVNQRMIANYSRDRKSEYEFTRAYASGIQMAYKHINREIKRTIELDTIMDRRNKNAR